MHFFVTLGILFSVLIRVVIRWKGGGGTSGSRALRTWQWVLNQIAAQRGGTVVEPGWRRISWLSADAEIDAHVHSKSHSHLQIRIRKSVPYNITFTRTPRLLYAFIESFISPNRRVEKLPYFIITRSADTLAQLGKSHSFGTLLQRLSDFGFSVQLDENGVTLKKRVWNSHLEDLPYLELLRLAEDFAGVCAAPMIDIPVQALASEQHCAYCKESIADGAPVTSCSLCMTPHHGECFDLNGGCSVFGCRSHQRIEPPSLVSSRL